MDSVSGQPKWRVPLSEIHRQLHFPVGLMLLCFSRVTRYGLMLEGRFSSDHAVRLDAGAGGPFQFSRTGYQYGQACRGANPSGCFW